MQSIINRLISLLVCFCLFAGLMPLGMFGQVVKADELDKDILYSCDFETEDTIDNLFFLDADGDGDNWVREDDFTNNYGLVSRAVSGSFNAFRTPYILLPDSESSTLSFKVRTDGPADYTGGLKVYIYVQGESSTETLAASYNFKENDTDRTNPGTFQVDLSEWKGKNVVIEFDNIFETGVHTEGFTVRIDDILVTAPAKKMVEVATFEQLCAAITMDTIDGRTLNLKLTDDVICEDDGDGMMIELKDKKQRVVLDLNGHALIRRAKTKNDFALIHLSQGELTIKDSSDGNGMIEASLTYNGVYIYPYSATICVGGDSRLTVEGGLIASSKGVDSAVFMRYGCSANVTINGGMFNGAKYGIYTQDSNEEHMTINGGEFKGGLLGIHAATYSPYIRINNAVSYAPVHFATSKSNVPSNIAPNTVVTVYKNESEIDSVYKDTTDYSSNVLEKRLYITGCYKIVFSTKPAIRWIKLTGALPRPGDIAGLGYIPQVSSGSVNVRDCRWLGEYGDEFAGEFKENISYTLRVTLEVGQDESFSDDIVAMVCGNKADVAFADLAGKKVMVSYKFPPTETRKLTGEVQFTSAANPGKTISFVVKNLPEDLSVDSLQYLWQKKVGDAWEIIEEDDATKRSFAPSADLLGKEVRVVITEPKSAGVIVSRGITVTKLVNRTIPVAPVLSIMRDDDGRYTNLMINNYRDDQEYVYQTSNIADTSTIDWTSNTISSDTINGLTEGATYYVYTRVKETEATQAGLSIIYSSIILKDPKYLQKVTLEGYSSYGDGNTIYIPVGKQVTINVSKEPEDAEKWSYFTFGYPAAQDCYSVTSESNVQDTMPKSITLKGEKVGIASLQAYYNSGMYSYGKWGVRVYDPDNIEPDYVSFVKCPVYDNITLNIDDRFTPDTPGENLMLPAEANAQYEYKWYVYEGYQIHGGTPYGAVTDNGYISVNPDTGEVTAISTEFAENGNRYQQSVVLYIVNRTDGSKKRVTEYKVTVNPADTIPVESVTVSPDEMKMAPGAQKTLTALVNPVNATVSDTMAWSKLSGSDNITVDESGNVTVSEAATEGESAVIQAKCGDKTGTCSVIVEKDTYFVTITDGMAYVGTKSIASAKVGIPVSIKADDAPEGKMFDHWVVESANALPDKADSSVTCFIMPAGDVKIKATYKDIPADVYQINVTDGVATVDGGAVTGAEAGTVITLTANAATTGKVFDKWLVESGSIILADSNNATTSFTMPAGDVSVKATYKDESSSAGETEDDGKTPGTEGDGKAPGTVDNGKTPVVSDNGNIPGTVDNGSTPVTADNIMKVGDVFKDNRSKASYRVTSAAGTGSVTAGGQPTVEYVAPVSKKIKSVVIPATVKADGVTYTVTSIGKKAFNKCSSLVKITIPAKVSKIGKQAFYGCRKLKTIIIKTSKLTNKKVHKTAFGKNAKKVTVTLPKMKGKKKAAYKKMLGTKGLKAAKFK